MRSEGGTAGRGVEGWGGVRTCSARSFSCLRCCACCSRCFAPRLNSSSACARRARQRCPPRRAGGAARRRSLGPAARPGGTSVCCIFLIRSLAAPLRR